MSVLNFERRFKDPDKSNYSIIRGQFRGWPKDGHSDVVLIGAYGVLDTHKLLVYQFCQEIMTGMMTYGPGSMMSRIK
jgi:hypothetical protein